MGDVETVTDDLERISDDTRKLVKRYEYDDLLRVSNMTYEDSRKAGVKGSFAYEYDKKSRVRLELHSNQWSDTVSDQRDRETTFISQENEYNGNGQRIRKKGYYVNFKEGSYEEEDNQYFYDDSTVLYTTSVEDAGMNAADNFYLHTKDMWGSTHHMLDEKGKAWQDMNTMILVKQQSRSWGIGRSGMKSLTPEECMIN